LDIEKPQLNQECLDAKLAKYRKQSPFNQNCEPGESLCGKKSFFGCDNSSACNLILNFPYTDNNYNCWKKAQSQNTYDFSNNCWVRAGGCNADCNLDDNTHNARKSKSTANANAIAFLEDANRGLITLDNLRKEINKENLTSEKLEELKGYLSKNKPGYMMKSALKCVTSDQGCIEKDGRFYLNKPVKSDNDPCKPFWDSVKDKVKQAKTALKNAKTKQNSEDNTRSITNNTINSKEPVPQNSSNGSVLTRVKKSNILAMQIVIALLALILLF